LLLIRLIVVRQYRKLLPVTDDQRVELAKWAQSRTLPAGDVFRARLILALADGATYVEIMRSLRTTAPTISRWKQRFEQNGIAGLDPRHEGSQPRVDRPSASAHRAPDAAKTRRRQHALVLPQDGRSARHQQVHRAARMGAGTPETAPPGSLHGFGRSAI
jgi:hypothetical protein